MWFRYGQDRRNFWSCWYSESLNGMALLDGFDQTGDPDMFVKGYAGVACVAANLLPDGMCFSQFVWSPEQFIHDPVTKEGGQGQWGFLQSTRSWLLRDPSFGWIGAGCRVQETAGRLRIVPRDGLRKRFTYPGKKLGIRLRSGELDWIELDAEARSVSLSVVDSMAIVRNVLVSIDGLAAGNYTVRYGSTNRRVVVSGPLELSVPIASAGRISIQRA